MPQRRVLHLDSQSLTAYCWRSDALAEEGRFPGDAAGQAAFANYLESHSRSLFYLLADVPEEGFNFEPIPYIQGGDRTTLIERKLKQFFYGSPLSTALSLGRERTGRRDERMLFLALTRPQSFEPWLKLFAEAESQLAGVYSVPLVSRSLVSRLKLAENRDALMVVTLGRAGVRQLYFEGGNLRFSRLSAVAAEAPAEVAKACAVESAKLYQYLVSQRMVARGTTLPCVVLVRPEQQAELASAFANTTDLRVDFADLVEAAATCGLRHLPLEEGADALFLYLLGQKPPSEQFAGSPERHMFHLWQLRTGLLGAGAVALLACLLYAGRQFYLVQELRHETAATASEAAEDSRRYAEILRGLPPMPTSVDNLRAVVTRYDALMHRTQEPQAMYVRISRAVERSPEVDIERIEWQLTATPDASGTTGSAPRPAVSGQAEATGDMYASALVTATLPALQIREQRSILRAIEGFVAALQGEPGLRATVLKLPFDVESGKTLRSQETGAASAEIPRFTVRITQKL